MNFLWVIQLLKYIEEIINLKLELTFNNCYDACETFITTLHQATDPIDDDDDGSRDGLRDIPR